MIAAEQSTAFDNFLAVKQSDDHLVHPGRLQYHGLAQLRVVRIVQDLAAVVQYGQQELAVQRVIDPCSSHQLIGMAQRDIPARLASQALRRSGPRGGPSPAHERQRDSLLGYLLAQFLDSATGVIAVDPEEP